MHLSEEMHALKSYCLSGYENPSLRHYNLNHIDICRYFLNVIPKTCLGHNV